MGRTWSTLPTTPPQWGKMTGIPADFSDGKIDWNEVANKPGSFTPTSHNHDILASTTFVQNGAGNQITGATTQSDNTGKAFTITGLNYSNTAPKYAIVSGQSTNTENTVQIGGGWSVLASSQRIEFWIGSYNALGGGSRIGYINNDGLIINKILATSLPSSSTGLPSGSFWRDSNGFVRAV